MRRIIAKKTLREFWQIHADSEQPLKNWFQIAQNAEWKKPSDVQQTFAHVSILKNGRMVFNIRGNSYRLVVKFNFIRQWAYIRFVGTHEEYDEIDANNI